MKNIFTFMASALLATSAWAGVITLDMTRPLNPATIEYDANTGVWTNVYNDTDYFWLEFSVDGGTFMLSHLLSGESWGGSYWDGFTPAIGGDMTDYGQPGSTGSWTTNFGGCMAGGGAVITEGGVVADPAEPYFVCYASIPWDPEMPIAAQVMFVDMQGNTEFEPVGVYVSNHPWPYYGCEHGDGFGRAFEEGDHFDLIAHGVTADKSEKTVELRLVEFVNGQLRAVNDWTFFDLSGLGKVESVYFTMNSTDVGDYGMNTAAYFCMDKFQVKADDSPSTAVEDLNADKQVAAVKYVNLAGQCSDVPFDGVNVVVTTHTDGTVSTAKVIR